MNDRSSEYDDPEQSYRRAYQQSAYEVVQVVSPHLLPSKTKKLENWVSKELFRWRLKAYVDETERVRPITSRQEPPSPPSL